MSFLRFLFFWGIKPRNRTALVSFRERLGGFVVLPPAPFEEQKCV